MKTLKTTRDGKGACLPTISAVPTSCMAHSHGGRADCAYLTKVTPYLFLILSLTKGPVHKIEISPGCINQYLQAVQSNTSISKRLDIYSDGYLHGFLFGRLNGLRLLPKYKILLAEVLERNRSRVLFKERMLDFFRDDELRMFDTKAKVFVGSAEGFVEVGIIRRY
jgi:hypothetical protein